MIKPWIKAARPRTLPLALSCIGMGSFLAAYRGSFDGLIFTFCILTTIFLQVLSNLSNDYGDSVHGADSENRKGPARAVQSGEITAQTMKNAMTVFAILALVSGVLLLWFALGRSYLFWVFLGIGAAAIVAAVTYTSGKNPYGYAGLGDISVLIFFGLVGVLGTYFLFAQSFETINLLPALSCGFFSVAVLNLNNIRDIESDSEAGKKSIPVRIGRRKAIIYHWFLLIAGFVAAIAFTLINFQSYFQFLFVVSLPLLLINGRAVSIKDQPSDLDPYLKQMALTTLLFVLTFGLGMLL